MKEEEKKRLHDSAVKKAAGYEAVETQEEYALVDGDLRLVKRKIIRKDIPPDVAAIKWLIGDVAPEAIEPEEIERERVRLEAAYFRRRAQREGKEKTEEATEKNGTDGYQV